MSKGVLPEKYFDIAFMRDGTFYMHYSENFSADDIYMTLSFFASVEPDAFAEACERRDGETTAEWTRPQSGRSGLPPEAVRQSRATVASYEYGIPYGSAMRPPRPQGSFFGTGE